MDNAFLLRLAHDGTGQLSHTDQQRADLLSRKRVDLPLILVNLSVSGQVAGAMDTWNAIEQYARERSMDIELIETGSIGLHSEEPLISVQMPQRTRLLFGKVTSDKVPSLMDDLFHQQVPRNLLIGQWRMEEQEPWPEVPYMDEIPFFALQRRITLEACGHIDPASLGEYIARGGYYAFLKIIREYTFLEVCELVVRSGLRGRGGGRISDRTEMEGGIPDPFGPEIPDLQCRGERSGGLQ